MSIADDFELPVDKWVKWNYQKSPFAHFSLNADQDGYDLLVGRKELLKSVIASFATWGKISSLNGGVGVGKTSLANVAAYILEKLSESARIEKKSNRYIYSFFENIKYEKEQSDEDFEFSIFVRLAEKIIQIKNGNSDFSWATLNHYDDYKKCILDPVFKERGFSVAPLGGIQGSSTPNSHPAHGKRAFIDTIKTWLDTLFPKNDSFIICVIDNFELMDEAERLVQFFEKNRDTLLKQNGLKFVLCGANNSVLKLKTSWLSAYIDNTIEVPSIDTTNAKDIYQTRNNKFAKATAYIPITEEKFVSLAKLIRVNTRDLIGEAEAYCEYIHRNFPEKNTPKTDHEKNKEFQIWIEGQTQESLDAIKKRITKHCWTILNIASNSMGGIFKSGDYDHFNIVQGSYSNVINILKDLKLIDERNDEEHKKKRIYTLTPKAYYILYAAKVGTINENEAVEDDAPGCENEKTNI